MVDGNSFHEMVDEIPRISIYSNPRMRISKGDVQGLVRQRCARLTAPRVDMGITV